MKNLWGDLKETAAFLSGRMEISPEVGLILGTGLGELAGSIELKGSLEYREIPNFPVSTALGHAGRLLWGRWSGKPVVALQGRFHYYEGYTLAQVAFPVRVMKLLGCRVLITTNAAGSLNPALKAGSIMVVIDHINLIGGNPLVGPNVDELGPRFPDLGHVYTPELARLALKIARQEGLDVQPGVLTLFSGPTYETAAEYRAFRVMGADAVGMSVIPEAIVAGHCGLKVLAFSGMTDECFHEKLKPLSGQQVVAVAAKIAPAMNKLISGVLRSLPAGAEGSTRSAGADERI